MAAKVNLTPLGDRVLIKKVEAEGKTSGGIFIPDTAKEKPQIGEVMAVGQGKYNDDGKRTPVDLKVGDKVIFAKYSGSEVKVDGVEYVVIAESDILATTE